MAKKRTSGITLDVGKPIIWYPGLSRFFETQKLKNGIAKDAAILYSCLDYWQDKSTVLENGFIYKYVEQLEKETGLVKSRQFTCRQFLKKINWLEEKTVKINGRNVIAFRTKYNLTTRAEKTINSELKN